MKDLQSEYRSEYKNQNLRQMRRYLKLTQKEFLDRFFQDDDGNRRISVATLSNMEARGGPQLDMLIIHISEQIGCDPMIFEMEPENFYNQLSEILADQRAEAEIRENGEKKGNIARLVNRLTMHFADQLLSGQIKRGDQIDSDRTLAKDMGVGRSAIREALKVLDVMGLIDIRPGDGTYISSRESEFFIIPLSWSLFMNSNQVDNILEMRDIVEVRSAELAAQCRDERKLTHLGTVFHEMQQAYVSKDVKEFLDLDIEFHLVIADCSGNQILSSLIQTIRNLLKWVSESGMSTEEHLRIIYEEHQRIYGCIISANPEGAGKAMHEHMERSRKRYTL